MSEITIPPEALEAAVAAALDAEPHIRDQLHAACIAMLRNWPGMHIHEWQRPWLGGMSGADIILPLTENQNE